jgi:hypothetical protein
LRQGHHAISILYTNPLLCLTITAQTHYFEVHESHHMVVKKLIEGGEHVKGTHTNPELRKKIKKQGPALRKKQNPAIACAGSTRSIEAAMT